jgi:hypothetical protein
VDGKDAYNENALSYEGSSAMLRQNPHLVLMGALDFSASDLADNSRGSLSPRQLEMMQQTGFRQIGLLVVGMIFMWFGGAELHVDGLALGFVSAVLGTLILSIYHRTRDDLKTPVKNITGRVAIQMTPFGSQVQVEGERFGVSREVGAAFVSGRIYRLYYASASRQLLSAELVA